MVDARVVLDIARSHVERILRASGVAPVEPGAYFFEDKLWRSLWYDPETGLLASAPWDRASFAQGCPLVPTENESRVMQEEGFMLAAQLPCMLNLPFESRRYRAQRACLISIDRFHRTHPHAMPLVEVPVHTDAWCRRHSTQ